MSINVEYVLGIILKKEIAFKSDEIAERAEKLVNAHFDSRPEKEKMLDPNQINRFTGIALSSNTPETLKWFIESQASKKRKGWIEKELDKHLLDEINKIKGDDSKQIYDDTICRVKEYIEEDITNKFNKKKEKEFIRNIAMELLREFATYFGIHYLYRRGKDVREA